MDSRVRGNDSWGGEASGAVLAVVAARTTPPTRTRTLGRGG